MCTPASTSIPSRHPPVPHSPHAHTASPLTPRRMHSPCNLHARLEAQQGGHAMPHTTRDTPSLYIIHDYGSMPPPLQQSRLHRTGRRLQLEATTIPAVKARSKSPSHISSNINNIIYHSLRLGQHVAPTLLHLTPHAAMCVSRVACSACARCARACEVPASGH